MSNRKGPSSSCLIIVAADECVLLREGDQSTVAEWRNESELREAVVRLVNSLDRSPKAVCFAITSELCLSCRFTPPSSTMKLSSEAIRFVAEAYLPMAAEDFAAIFQAEQDAVFCVTAARNLLSSLTGSVSVATRVIPLALLIAEAAMLDRNNDDSTMLTFRHRDRIESLRWHNAVCEWWSEPIDETGPMIRSVASDVTTAPVELQFDNQDEGIQSLATTAIDNVATARLNTIDLLRDPVLDMQSLSDLDTTVQRICQTVVVSAVIAVLFLVNRRASIQEELIDVEQVQAAVFETQLPGAPPTGINRKLNSELVRQRALTEQTAVWAERHAGADTVFAEALQACLSVPSVALNNIEVTGKVVAMEVQGKTMDVGGSLQRALAERGLTAEVESTRPEDGIPTARLSAVTTKDRP